MSLEERYGTPQKYVDQVAAATKALVSDRLILQDDADLFVKAAQAAQLGLPAN